VDFSFIQHVVTTSRTSIAVCKQALLPAALLLTLSNAIADRPRSISYMPDGSVKAYSESEYKNDKAVKTEVFDRSGRLEFVEYPIYNASGKFSGKKRIGPDSKPWPYEFPVYGSAALGGTAKVQDDIRQIESLLAKIGNEHPILEVVFINRHHVRVNTGVIKGPLNGHGRYYNLKKKNGVWIQPNKDKAVTWWA